MKTIAILLSVLLVVGCSGAPTPKEQKLAQTRAPLAISDTATFPYPVQQITTFGQEVKSNWDGTLVDLLAADAFGLCATSLSTDFTHGDRYLDYLGTKINNAACGTLQDATLPASYRWIKQRTSTDYLNCNYIGSTQRTGLLPIPTDNSALYSPSGLPPVRWYPYFFDPPFTATHTAPAIGTGAFSSTVAAAKVQAQQEMAVPAINLCMANRLREQMNSADILVASGTEQRQLLEIIRERAQIAMLELTQIFRVFADSAALAPVSDVNQYLPWFRSHYNALTGAQVDQLTMDLLTAVRVHTEVTQELAELLGRSASARGDVSVLGGSGYPDQYADVEWGPGGWRSRTLDLLYGGDPLGTLFALVANAPVSENFAWGNYVAPHYSFDGESILSASLSRPEVQSLFGLARQANVLYLKRQPAPAAAYDVDVSGSFIWSAVEAYLENQDCVAAGTPCSLKADSPQISALVSSYEDSVLWKRYHVAPEHGTALAKALAQGVPPPPGLLAPRGAFHISGAVTTYTKPDELITATTESWDKFASDIDLTGIPLAARASNRSQFGSYFLPGSGSFSTGTAYYNFYATGVGFVSRQAYPTNIANPSAGWFGLSNDALRYVGSVPALAAVRDSLVAGNQATTVVANLYGTSSPIKQILGLIDSAIGTSTIAIRPKLQSVAVTTPSGKPCGDWATTSNACNVLAMEMVGTTKVKATVDLVRPTGSEALKLLLVTPADVQTLTGNYWDIRHIANIAAQPTYKSMGANETERLDINDLNGLATSKGVASTQTSSSYLGVIRDRYEVSWEVTSDGTPQYNTPSVLLAYTPTTGTPTKYVVLSDSFMVRGFNWSEARTPTSSTPVIRSTGGYYLGVGGTLGSFAAKLLERHPTEWSRASFDGFGYPVDWTPPATPELLAGATDPVAFYLSGAKEAAQNATAAVTSALDAVVQEAADSQRLQASRQRSAEISKLEKEAVCGESDCDASTLPWDPPREVACDGVSRDTAFFIVQGDNPYCSRLDTGLANAIPEQIQLLAAVTEKLGADAAPSFSDEFGGGGLQALAVSQWNAAKKIDRIVTEAAPRLNELWYTENAAFDNWHAAQAVIDAQLTADTAEHTRLEAEMTYRCLDQDLRNKAYNAMFTFQADIADSRTDIFNGIAWIEDPSAKVPGEDKISGWNPGSYYAWQDNCRSAYNAVTQFENSELPHAAASAEGPRKTWLAAQEASDESLLAVISSVIAAVADLRLAIANTEQAIAGLDRTEAKITMDSFVDNSGVTSQLPIARRYHQADMWRARALLENARRLSVAARRSIEARYNVDLSTMQEDEPFVAAPALWADEVYAYDLDPPSAVGLSQSGASVSGVYPNKLVDYVTNLENFVRGYPVKRPTAAATGDTEVITLAGPGADETAVDATNTTDATRWSFQCGDDGPWISNPVAAPEGGSTLKWTFEELTPPFKNHGLGGALDLSTVTGTLGTTRAAVDGFALDANTDNVKTAATTVGESGGITVSMWVNPRVMPSTYGDVLVMKQYAPTWVTPFRSFELGRTVTNGYLRASINIAGTVSGYASSTVVPLNKWSHIAGTYDGYTLRLYLNGVEVKSVSISTTTPSLIDWGTHGPWVVGGATDTYCVQCTNSWIGPVRVDTVAKTADDIAAYYQEGIPNTRASATWWFDQAAAPFQSTGTLPSIPLSAGIGSVSPAPLPPFDSTAYFGGNSCLTSGATANGATTSMMSASAWVYPTDHGTSGNKVILSKSFNTSTWATPWASVELFTAAGNFYVAVTLAGQMKNISSPTALALNKWSHVGMNFDGSNLEAYVNGALVKSINLGAPAQIDWGNQGPWMVGGNCILNGEFFKGWIAKVRIDPVSRPASFFSSAYGRGLGSTCFMDAECDLQEDCCEDYVPSAFDTLCADGRPTKARIEFHLDPWGREGEYFVHDPYTERHNVRWGRLAVNLVGTGIRDCAHADDSLSCYAESFLRYDLAHAGPAWSTDYSEEWHTRPIPIGQIEGGKALATEEWLDPISNSWNTSFVSNVARQELLQRPVSGTYTLDINLSPDVRPERIDRVQILAETEYWVRQR